MEVPRDKECNCTSAVWITIILTILAGLFLGWMLLRNVRNSVKTSAESLRATLNTAWDELRQSYRTAADSGWHPYEIRRRPLDQLRSYLLDLERQVDTLPNATQQGADQLKAAIEDALQQVRAAQRKV